MMKGDDFKMLGGFADRLTDKQTDICDCRVAFATENTSKFLVQENERNPWTQICK